MKKMIIMILLIACSNTVFCLSPKVRKNQRKNMERVDELLKTVEAPNIDAAIETAKKLVSFKKKMKTILKKLDAKTKQEALEAINKMKKKNEKSDKKMIQMQRDIDELKEEKRMILQQKSLTPKIKIIQADAADEEEYAVSHKKKKKSKRPMRQLVV